MAADATRVIGIVGLGAMGRGIAQIAAQAGVAVRMVDARPGAVGEARASIAAALEKLAQKGKVTAADAAAAVERLVPCDDLAGLVGEGCLLASNT